MVFPKETAVEYDLSCIKGKDDISFSRFSRKYDLTPRRKMKDDLAQKSPPPKKKKKKKKKQNKKKHGNMIFSKKMVLSNRIALGYDLSCTICKGGSFFPENTIFFPWTENEKGMIFRRKYTEAWYFLCKRTGATNVTPRSSPAKKNQRWSYPTKIHLKMIDILDRHPRKSSSNSLYFHGDLYRRFHISLSSETRNLIHRIKVWLLLQFIRLKIFYNE